MVGGEKIAESQRKVRTSLIAVAVDEKLTKQQPFAARVLQETVVAEVQVAVAEAA